VTAQKAARSGFQYDEKVVVTEKLHGSNARYVYLDGVMYAGSHFQWKAPDSPCIFTRVLKQYPWIEEWCRSNEGRVLYGEVIGDQKGYTYGLDKTKGELDFRAFDIREPDGTWTKPWKDAALSTEAGYGANSYNGIRTVPILWSGTADILKIKELTDGKSAIDGKTQREGVVISETAPARVGYRRPRQLKRVSNLFLEKDSK
jgi:ATP-dependent RNA circularization protein (DNA/RNA ligase family)